MQKLFLFFIFLFLVFFAHTTLAANLNLSPSSGSYNVGDAITVRVVLSSPTQSANAVSGTLDFPRALLTLNSVSKSNSLVNLWAVEPSFSNASGTANMEGIILNGYQGNSGTILTLSFKAKAAGNANLKFTAFSVLANDGQGTNISTGAGQASFNISKAVEKEAPVIELTPEPVSEVVPKIVTVSIPVFIDYSKDVKEGEFLVVKGLTDPNIDVVINSSILIDKTFLANTILVNENKIKKETIIKSDGKGIFIYISEKVLPGIYEITAHSLANGIESQESLPIKIKVLPKSVPVITTVINTFSTIIPILALIILLIIFVIWGWYKVLHYKERMKNKLIHTKTLVAKSLNILDEDIAEEIKIFKKIRTSQPLTKNERLLINQLKKDIESAEKIIIENIKDSE